MGRCKYALEVTNMVEKMVCLHMDYQDIIDEIQLCYPQYNYSENQLYKLIEKCLVKRL